MKTSFALALILLASNVLAKEAVLFNYILEEHVAADNTTTSEFGFLVDFKKNASASIGNTAQLDMLATDLGDKVRVDLTLLDYIDGDLVEVGRGSVDVLYGTRSEISWQATGIRGYRLSISPSRHSLSRGGA